ncbi:MAG: hypothetical protein JW963_20760 [Anaerolineales bacterium]|nr:hypothetical protein [Anaerolineales bacterium]
MIIENLDWVIWGLLYFFGFIYYQSTKKYGGWRGLFSAWGHLTILLGGWLTGKIFGIIYISIPLLILYYYVLYRIAEVIIPASDPDNPKEIKQRFNTLVHYMWGLQFPILMAAEPTSTSADTRIDGNASQKTIGKPGYIWTNLHQVVGITTGTSFSRVEGPGAIYTGSFERPLEVIDLRTQLRTTEVEALTQDGIPIKAIVFASFCIDKDPWDRDQFNLLKHANPLLRGGMEAYCGEGNFRYSPARVRAVLGIGGVKATTTGTTKDSSIRWDEQVMNLIGETTRHVISEIPLSELWLPNPQIDEKWVSALDLIASEITNRVSYQLQMNGVRLFAARVVNYFLLGDKPDNEVDEITQQQLPAWQARWEQEVNLRLAEADAEVEQKLLDVSVVARSMFIAAIAQALEKNKITGKDLNRYLIALRILSAFDERGEERGQIGRDPVSLLRSIFSQSKK